MARFYLDHDVSLRLALLLQAAGHDVSTAQDVGLAHASDDERLLTVTQQARIVLTHNRKDYVLLHDAWLRWSRAWGVPAPAHVAILVLDHRPEPDLATPVDAFVATPSVPLTNALYWWRYRSGWHHQLPNRRWVPYP